MWDLEQNWDTIATKSTAAWTREVEQAAEKQNKSRLFDIGHSRQRGTSRLKTKTRSIAEVVQLDTYKRLSIPILDILTTSRQEHSLWGIMACLTAKTILNGVWRENLCWM